MVNCSYCSKLLDRLIFCSPSHKVLYHRKKLPLSKLSGTKKDTIKPQEEVILVPKSNIPTKIKKKVDKNGYCIHYIRAEGYCRECGR